MSDFVLKEIEAIKGGKYDFYKLEINGTYALDVFEKEIRTKLFRIYNTDFLCTVIFGWIYYTTR